MNIEEAWEILHEYYSEEYLKSLYVQKKFDGSETDIIREHAYNAKLLSEKAAKSKDQDEIHKLYEAAEAFSNLVKIEESNC